MPQITVLPHHELCPEGVVITAKTGQTICEALVKGGVGIEHACEHACACSTCHVIVREGFNSLPPAEEDEEDGHRSSHIGSISRVQRQETDNPSGWL